ncbi:uncharacterized protein At2g29880-like [Cajanus cajan]|uniref:uncharacterized protein At2g29880-like n=1 Tax=Cajanus cajan TaxID=3821 RepID=UPI00098D9036|nr:uncharacterized protein At2g29880-like [Cajanus cajan]
MSTLMHNNSGFGWDPITKTFTASDEPHLSHKDLREKSMLDYEDLKIVVGGKTVSGNTSMSLDPNDIDPTTFEENVDFGIENFSYDLNNDVFITPDHYEPPYQPPSPHPSISRPQPPLSLEDPTEKPINHKWSRPKYGVSSNLVGNNNQAKVLENLSVGIETIVANFEKMSNLMEKKERYQEAKGNIWSAIKEIPNLDD